MRRQKSVCFSALALIIVGVTSTASAITSSGQTIKAKSILKQVEPVEELPSPTPSPSPSTEAVEFSSRRGTTSKTSKKEKEDGFRPSIPFTKFAERNKNSSAAASSKAQQITYPDQTLEEKSREQSEVGNKEDGPQAVVLELLDDKDVGEGPDSPDAEERSKFPRVYYGEVSSRQHQGPGEEEHDPSSESRKHNPELIGPNLSSHPPKYFYPKSYVHNKHGHKGKSNKKKRFEYHYDEDTRQIAEHQHEPINPDYPTQQHTPEDSFYQSEQYGKEYSDGFEQDGREPGYQGGYRGEHRGPGAADVISKALHLLIPSALILTGLSAVFPNRVHVPTNDFYRPLSPQHIRQRRSIRHAGDLSEKMLEPEHRSLHEGVPLPGVPSYKSYNFEIGSPRNKKLEFIPIPDDQYSGFEDFSEDNQRSEKIARYNRKISGFKEHKGSMRSMNGDPQNPEEYNRFHFDFSSPDSTFSPSSITTPTFAALPENPESENQIIPSEKPKRKVRTRTAVKVRAGKRKSRPLPLTTQAPIIDINEFQSHLIGAEKSPIGRHIVNSQAKQNIRLGDAYLHSLVEGHEEEALVKKEKGRNMDLSADSPVVGLLTSFAQHDKDSPACQKRALCELAIKGKTPTASKFETFLWSLASLVPDQFSKIYELDDIFAAVKGGSCEVFQCFNPNMDLQVR